MSGPNYTSTGPHGRLNADTEHNNPTPFPAIPHASHLSRSLLLFGYAVTFERIEQLQKDFANSAGDSVVARDAILKAIRDDYVGQFDGCMKVFVENGKCGVCHGSPLVAGSRHAAFANVATRAIWDELEHDYNDIKDKASPLDLAPAHIFFIKRMFEKLEASYRYDNVAALCGVGGANNGSDDNGGDEVPAAGAESSTTRSGEGAVREDAK